MRVSEWDSPPHSAAGTPFSPLSFLLSPPSYSLPSAVCGNRPHHSPGLGCTGPSRELHSRESHATVPGYRHLLSTPGSWCPLTRCWWAESWAHPKASHSGPCGPNIRLGQTTGDIRLQKSPESWTHPALNRAAASAWGLTDLPTARSGHFSLLSQVWKKIVMPMLRIKCVCVCNFVLFVQ